MTSSKTDNVEEIDQPKKEVESPGKILACNKTMPSNQLDLTKQVDAMRNEAYTYITGCDPADVQ